MVSVLPWPHFVGRAEENFELRKDSTTTQNVRELAWFLLRLISKNALKADDTYGEQSVSGWRAFNVEISPITLPRTVIGYCPMIAGSPISKHLQQSTAAVITFDLTIYSRAKEIHWRYPEEFQNRVICLGRGGHIALNYLASIGKMLQESGLEDVFIESGLYGSSSAMALLQGKSYNKGIKGHKLIMEVLLRLKWDTFCS